MSAVVWTVLWIGAVQQSAVVYEPPPAAESRAVLPSRATGGRGCIPTRAKPRELYGILQQDSLLGGAYDYRREHDYPWHGTFGVKSYCLPCLRGKGPEPLPVPTPVPLEPQ